MQPISRSSWYPVILLGLDTALIAFGLWLAYFIRFETGLIPPGGGHEPLNYLRAWPFVTLLLVVSMSFMRLYDYGMRTFDIEIFHRVTNGAFLGIGLFVLADFFMRAAEFSRATTLLSLVTVVSSVSLGRHYLSLWLTSRKVAGIDVRRVTIVGTGRAAAALAQRIADNPQYGYHTVGFIAESGEAASEADQTALEPRLGHLRELRTLLRAHEIDLLIVASPHVPHADFVEIFKRCEEEFVGCKIAPDLFEMMLRDMQVENLEGIPLMSFKETPLQGWNFILKRLFDVVASLVLLIIVSPVFAVIAAMIKMESRGPIFYLQERMGLDGRVFRMIKFRSMHIDAEADGPVWSRDHDPRRTRVGRIIRTLNLDELPQLLNVLRGDMSIVGPRPERPHFIDQFKQHLPRYMARHRVRAGITGWAQVHGLRGNTPIDERLKFDLYYVENWSFWMDIKILLMTLWGRRRTVHG
ncbi:undecaprenyl-phosphate glucose phosphotransferase [Candidatus Sumerlaeota bacterium]|nr:undecaprenyl-phosphate glucose phosphotransferase [Candidatus Sumerlaeota bacterium]